MPFDKKKNGNLQNVKQKNDAISLIGRVKQKRNPNLIKSWILT